MSAPFHRRRLCHRSPRRHGGPAPLSVVAILLIAGLLAGGCGPVVDEPVRSGGPAAASLSELVAALQTPSARERYAAARALADAGDGVARALEPALADPDWVVRAQATWILGELGPPGVAGLTGALEDDSWEVRGEAALALGKIPEAEAVHGLTGAVADGNPWVRFRAARSLGRLGSLSGPAAPALVRGLDDELPEVRRSMAAALIAIGPVAVPAVVDGLDSSRARVRRESAWVLGQLGDAAREAMSELERIRGADPSAQVRRAAAAALRRIRSRP